jgi:hypothetical protein
MVMLAVEIKGLSCGGVQGCIYRLACEECRRHLEGRRKAEDCNTGIVNPHNRAAPTISDGTISRQAASKHHTLGVCTP